MSNFWMTQETLRLVGWAYIPACVGALLFALWIPKRWWMKTIAAGCVLGLASILPLKAKRQHDEAQAKAAEFAQRQAKARAIFEERCKAAGVKRHKTVQDVDGVLLEKVRPKMINSSDQYGLDDPFGRDVGGDGYISSFLRVPHESHSGSSTGYRYVDVAQSGNTFQRYVLERKFSPAGVPYTELRQIAAASEPSRYEVTYQDISLKADREHWIAGGRLVILDRKFNEVIAERTGFIFDPELGNTAGGRGPWEAAISCGTDDRNYGHTARFVFSSLRPSK